MTRKEFLASTAAMAAAGTAGAASSRSAASPYSVKPRNRRPYDGIDWATAHQIRGTTHVHCVNQEMLDVILKRIEFLTISNYYPSAPWYPLSKMTENYYRVHHDFPVVVNGRRTEGPFDWNAIVGQWIDEVHPDRRKEFPFKEGAPLFKPLPPGVLEAPNAEHHHFKLKDGTRSSHLHLNSPGSLFASGTFDQWRPEKRWFQGLAHGYDFGSGEEWTTAIDRMLAALMYPDGGGVTVNHPEWTAIDRSFLLSLLDHDPRVLGMEVIAGGGVNSEAYWDWVLATGRQCFGFFVPDHSIWNASGTFGVNVLVTPERSVHACLKAYREGNFYGAKRGLNELRFTRIVFDGDTVTAEVDKPARLMVVTAMGTVHTADASRIVSWTLPQATGSAAPKRNVHVFARIKAVDAASGEELFSQPYLFVPGK